MKTYSLTLSETEICKNYNYIDLNLKPLSVFKDTIRFDQDTHYDKIRIPKKYHSLLLEALTKYNKQEYIDEFISFIPIVQECYLHHKNLIDWSTEDPMLKDLIYENSDLIALLPVMKAYFQNRKELTRISFKVGQQPAIKITNRNIILEICKGIASTYGFTEEGFRKYEKTGKEQELLEMQGSQRINEINTPQYLQAIKSLVVKDIIKFLGDDSNDNMKFVGLFLNICQLRSNNSTPINFKDTLEENLTMQDPNKKH